jgi:hypothetical protein
MRNSRKNRDKQALLTMHLQNHAAERARDERSGICKDPSSPPGVVQPRSLTLSPRGQPVFSHGVFHFPHQRPCKLVSVRYNIWFILALRRSMGPRGMTVWKVRTYG